MNNDKIKKNDLDSRNQNNNNCNNNDNDNNSRGSCTVRTCDYGFQTWGPGSRFACVPTKHGNAWYIAVGNSEMRVK